MITISNIIVETFEGSARMLILTLILCFQPFRRIGEMQGANVQQPREE